MSTNWKLKYGIFSYLLGFSMLFLNLTAADISDTGMSWGFIFGIAAATMLLLMGTLDIYEWNQERKNGQD